MGLARVDIGCMGYFYGRFFRVGCWIIGMIFDEVIGTPVQSKATL